MLLLMDKKIFTFLRLIFFIWTYGIKINVNGTQKNIQQEILQWFRDFPWVGGVFVWLSIFFNNLFLHIVTRTG